MTITMRNLIEIVENASNPLTNGGGDEAEAKRLGFTYDENRKGWFHPDLPGAWCGRTAKSAVAYYPDMLQIITQNAKLEAERVRREEPMRAEAKRNGGYLKLYHLTDNAKFTLDPNFEPQDNAFAMSDRSGHAGIYLAKDAAGWAFGRYGYVRPFVAEIHADPSVLDTNTIGRWGGEIFVPAEHFDKLKVYRVVPLDVIARERYGAHGWIETSHGFEFDTGNKITAETGEYPFRDWTYDKDTRNMSRAEISRIKRHFNMGNKARLKNQ